MTAIKAHGRRTKAGKPRAGRRRAAVTPLLVALWISVTALAGNRLSGEQAFAACSACHSLAKGAPHKVGPNLWNVYGREAAQAQGYNYSPSLAESGITWTRENLFAWIAGSEAMVPGSWMLFHNTLHADEVMSLIDYLATEGRPDDFAANGSTGGE